MHGYGVGRITAKCRRRAAAPLACLFTYFTRFLLCHLYNFPRHLRFSLPSSPSYHFVCLSVRRVTFRLHPPPRKCISIGRGSGGYPLFAFSSGNRFLRTCDFFLGKARIKQNRDSSEQGWRIIVFRNIFDYFFFFFKERHFSIFKAILSI